MVHTDGDSDTSLRHTFQHRLAVFPLHPNLGWPPILLWLFVWLAHFSFWNQYKLTLHSRLFLRLQGFKCISWHLQPLNFGSVMSKLPYNRQWEVNSQEGLCRLNNKGIFNFLVKTDGKRHCRFLWPDFWQLNFLSFALPPKNKTNKQKYI